MPYSNLPIGTSNPGLVIILVDQSSSMSESYLPPQDRSEFAAQAVNRCIYEILAKCRDGSSMRDRCHVAVLGYGQQSKNLIIAGKPSDLEGQIKRVDNLTQKKPDGAGGLVDVSVQLPVWVEAVAAGSTPMAGAFDFATELTQAWAAENTSNFPPVCINITDGEPDDPALAEAAANRLMQTGTQDGTTLIFNAHIGDPAHGAVQMPSSDSQLNSGNAKFLFRVSSPIPTALEASARNVGFNIQPGSRGMVMNADPGTLTALIQFGSQHAR